MPGGIVGDLTDRGRPGRGDGRGRRRSCTWPACPPRRRGRSCATPTSTAWSGCSRPPAAPASPRVVCASSNHAAGFTPVGAELPADLPPRPDTLYGVSKVFGEALGRYYAERYGLQVACLRIGTFTDRPRDMRTLSTWLSPDDCARLVDACLRSPDLTYAIVWGVSANTRRTWSLDAGRALGYEPARRRRGLRRRPARAGAAPVRRLRRRRLHRRRVRHRRSRESIVKERECDAGDEDVRAWIADEVDPSAGGRAAGAARRRRRRRAGRPVRRAADLRHGRAARAAARRPERHEPRGGAPGRRRPGRLADRAGPRRPPRRDRLRRPARLGRTSPATPRRSSPPPASTPACCRASCPRRCSPSPCSTWRGRRRHGHGVAQPAAGQRLQGLRRRTARRSCRPTDTEIEAAIQAVGPTSRDRRWTTTRSPCWTTRCVEDYVAAVAALIRADGPRELRIVHTAMHGVGTETVRAVFAARRIRRRSIAVPAAGAPRPRLPDRRLPQPRGAGRARPRARAGAGARRRHRHRQRPRRRPVRRRRPAAATAGWRMLRGDEVGVLLGDALLRAGRPRHVRDHDRLVVDARRAGRAATASGTPRRSPGSSGSRGRRPTSSTATRRRWATPSHPTWSATRTASAPHCVWPSSPRR